MQRNFHKCGKVEYPYTKKPPDGGSEKRQKKLERVTGFEPATVTLAT